MQAANVTVEKCQYSDSRETSWNVFVNGVCVGRVRKFKDTATDTNPYTSLKATASGPWALVEHTWTRDHASATAARKHAVATLVASASLSQAA